MFYKKGKVIFDHPREEKFKQNSCTSKLRPKNSLQLFFAVLILFWGLVGWRRRLLGIGKLYFCFFFNPRQTKVTTGFSLLPQISNLFIETQSWIRILCFFFKCSFKTKDMLSLSHIVWDSINQSINQSDVHKMTLKNRQTAKLALNVKFLMQRWFIIHDQCFILNDVFIILLK